MPCVNRLAGQGRGIPLRLPGLRALAATMKATRRKKPCMASDRPITMALCRESRFTMGAPLVHFSPRCRRRAFLFPTPLVHKGSRGAGSHCQLNRGINPCAWIGRGLASSANNARLAAKTSGMIRLSSRVENAARRACFGFFGCCGYCWEW